MDAITLDAVVSEDRRLVVDLPANVPVGPVELVIQPVEQAAGEQPLTLEAARARLAAAGRLSTTHHPPAGTVPLSAGERERLSKLFAGPRTVLDLVNEDRGCLSRE